MKAFFTWWISLLILLSPTVGRTANLPSQVSAYEMDKLIELIGVPMSGRLFRSADPYALMPGIKLGMEMMAFSTNEINQLGNADGTIPPLALIPRIYFAKGLPFSTDIVINYLPPGLFSKTSSFSTSLKTTLMREQFNPLSLAVFGTFTTTSAFSNYEGNSFEIGAVMSKDWVGLKPYFGAGYLYANAKLKESGFSGFHNSLHIFFGAELDFAANLAIQVDLMNLSPTVGLLAAYKL